jgi:UPF0271 protein
MNLEFIGEGFADRTYCNDGSLTPRTMPNALITEKNVSIEQAMNLVENGMIKTTSGTLISMPVKTICIHGDGEHAVEFAKALNQAFKINNIVITY